MSRLKALILGKPIHERRIEMRTYQLENDRLVVEGWLRDERFEAGYHLDGRPRPPGMVHWIVVRMLVGGWPLSILDVEAEMLEVPRELCQTTLEGLKQVIGLSIASGYSKKVAKRLGGAEGCAHLAHLVAAMGPAALHGYWTQRSSRKPTGPRSMDELPINSCKLWKPDGPLVQEIRAAFDGTNLEPK
jgi:hypothetical protein